MSDDYGDEESGEDEEDDILSSDDYIWHGSQDTEADETPEQRVFRVDRVTPEDREHLILKSKQK